MPNALHSAAAGRGKEDTQIADRGPAMVSSRREVRLPLSGVIAQGARTAILSSLSVLALFVIWEVLVRFELMNRALFPSLLEIWDRGLFLAEEGLLWKDISASLYRLLIGVICGIVTGTLLGLFMGMNRVAEYILAGPMNVFLAIPGLAIFPLAILWFGLSDFTLIAVLWFECAITVMVGAWTGVKTVDASLIRAGRAMGANGARLFFTVLVPGALPGLIASYRIAFSRGWRILVAGEMLAALGSGLGFRIFNARDFAAADVMYAGVIVVGLLGFTLERVLLRSIELATVQRWGTLRD